MEMIKDIPDAFWITSLNWSITNLKYQPISYILNLDLYFLFKLFSRTCADPESFVRGGPTLMGFFFSLMTGEDPNTIYHKKRAIGHPQPNSETPLKWRFTGGPMMA